ncbi:O-glucosyltransferase rumi-like isoform X1 [Oryza brachyantha]|uniref:O-glucosyltransferase rumi-like isoform X1 n=1 Tax=Oryza brachyantha TaxID=4533 RepID=UPI001ADBB8C4|nr:O-glucosyltransferase rumi-like isoform X1 [Oryza brachyantha]
MRGVGSVMVGVVFLALLILIPRWLGLDASFLRDSTMVSTSAREWHPHHNVSTPPLMPLPFSCGNATAAATCPAEPSLPARPASGGGGDHPAPTCPDYFRYIHDDLRPWRGAGITREAVERGRRHAYFRLVVVSGRAFVETYRRSYQTRDVFTQWGILQLMRRYAGRVPDVDIMFACDDPGQVRAADFAAAPADAPPVFRYCKDKTTLDVVFPDWSFWGWPEVNIGAWPGMLEAVRRENERVRWPEREPFAFWKGNPGVARIRGELMKCNPSNGKDWNARLFTQDWNHAIQNGFKDSSIPKQCLHRYKIYIEGNAWSVSEKYILACDSPVLFVTTPYQDILSRGLVAGEHYWPINRTRMCGSIKLAVDWGNAHPAAARRIGERGSRFVREQMSMDYVYDYMLHLLTEYGKLLRYRPAVPEKAVEICAASMACPAKGRRRECMDESVEEFVAGFEPCALPPPFTEEEAREIAAREEKVLRRVEKMEENIAS